MTDLHTSIQRLKDFRASWNEGDQIDEESKLSTADLDAIIRHSEATENMVSIKYVDMARPDAWKAFTPE
jgi:hypothetical protein